MKTQIFTSILLLVAVSAISQNIYTITDQLATLYSKVAIDVAGNIYVAAPGNEKIFKIDEPTGNLTVIAGTGTGGYNGDSIPAVSAQLWTPHGVVLDDSGNIYIADYSNRRIRKIVASTGLIYTIAGTGNYGYNGDNIPATSAWLSETSGITLDSTGNIYFSDLGNARIRKVNVTTGLISTVAGTGVQGYNGDTISAVTAKINTPYGIALDNSGNIFFADKGNQRVRKIELSSGFIYTVAGTGTAGYNGDNISAATATLYDPSDVDVDDDGNIYIADNYNNRIRKVYTSGIINTVAGNGTAGYYGDGGPAISAQLSSPRGVYVDRCGKIYITDYYYHRIRKVTSYEVFVTDTDATCNSVCNGTVSASAAGGSPPYTYSWSGGLGAGQSHTGVCSGSYIVSITDSAGCSEFLSVQVAEPQAITIAITTVPATCANDGIAYADVNGGIIPYTFSWTNDTSSSASGLSAGNYTLTVTDGNNCSATENFTVNNDSASFTSVPVCLVTADSLSQHNIIVWDKTVSTNADTFFVYREIFTNDYRIIARIPFDSLSRFTDTVSTLYFPNTGDPNAGTYRYKIQTRDTCGSYSAMSPYHNTIYFLNNNGNFYWTQPYTIENGANPVSSYILLRDDSSNGNWQPVASVAGTQQVVSDPLYVIYQNTASWRVKTQWSISCTPTLKNLSTGYSSSYSNIYKYYVISNASANNPENSLIIFPNPADGKLTVQSSDNIQSLEIRNILGKCIYNSVPAIYNSSFAIDLSGVEPGIYFLHINSVDGSVVRKILKQ